MVVQVSSTDPRSLKALAILATADRWQRGHTKDGRSFYAVPSQSVPNAYHMADCHACTCKDFERRQTECKHRIAARLLCEEFKACKAAAQRGETLRPSSALLQAIRWPEKPKATGCRECGAPTDFNICSGCFFGQRAAA